MSESKEVICFVNGRINKKAVIKLQTARKKLGGIFVTIYPYKEDGLGKAKEVRQSTISDDKIRDQVISLAQKKGKKKKKLKRNNIARKRFNPKLN